MRVAVFSTKTYDRQFLVDANGGAGHDLRFLEPRLTGETAPLAAGADAVCAFVNDDVSADVLSALSDLGVSMVALRSAGYNHVDIDAKPTRRRVRPVVADDHGGPPLVRLSTEDRIEINPANIAAPQVAHGSYRRGSAPHSLHGRVRRLGLAEELVE